jgi:1-pyrroline-4-hydroxy-2-carboxylate deaminase
MIMAKPNWHGVFPALPTQFTADGALDLKTTQWMADSLIRDGIHGLIACGTVGENCSLTVEEKRSTVRAIVEAAAGRVPVVAGVAEYTTDMACNWARDVKKAGGAGLMVLPAMVYSAQPHETVHHFRAIAGASDLPIMLYNNPPIYRTDVTPAMAVELADCPTIVAIKESSGQPHRLVDLQRMLGDRYILFCGLDDVVVESMLVGAVGWVSGLSNAFPKEANAMFDLARRGRWAEARRIYSWFMPLLHLDAGADLVQCIKLCSAMAGYGGEHTRAPRLALRGARRAEVEAIMREALRTRPALTALAAE